MDERASERVGEYDEAGQSTLTGAVGSCAIKGYLPCFSFNKYEEPQGLTGSGMTTIQSVNYGLRVQVN